MPTNLIRWHYLWYVGLAFAAMIAVIASHHLWSLNFVHVFCGLLWTGIDLFMGFVLGPILRRIDIQARKAVLLQLTPRTLFLMPTLAIITGTTGWYLAGRAGDDRERRHQEQRARRKLQEHGLAGLNIDPSQDRAEHETHEQIDPGPQQAAEHMDEVQRPEVMARDHGDHGGKRNRHIPQVIPADEIGWRGLRHRMLKHSNPCARRQRACLAWRSPFPGSRPSPNRSRSPPSAIIFQTNATSCARPPAARSSNRTPARA